MNLNEDIISLIEESQVLHLLAQAAQINSSYWNDFLKVVDDFRTALDKKQFDKFLGKSQLNKNITHAQYLQFVVETVVVDYIIRKFNGFQYEPKYKKKNPECSFEFEGRRVNIEVKCPDYSNRMVEEQCEGVKIYATERFPTKAIHDEVIEIINQNTNFNTVKIHRMDNKLRDYLISAHDKFPSSSKNYFNILVICLDITSDMDEWYSYLFGDTGAFTKQSFISDDYKNVDAVLLTNIVNGHMGNPKYNNINCWKMENYLSLLLLNPLKEDDEELATYYFEYAIKIFGNSTMDFLMYQIMLDQEANKRVDNLLMQGYSNEMIMRFNYTEEKILSLQIISDWCKTILNRSVLE